MNKHETVSGIVKNASIFFSLLKSFLFLNIHPFQCYITVYRSTWLGNWKLLIIDIIVNINLDYLKKAVHNLSATNIQGRVV